MAGDRVLTEWRLLRDGRRGLGVLGCFVRPAVMIVLIGVVVVCAGFVIEGRAVPVGVARHIPIAATATAAATAPPTASAGTIALLTVFAAFTRLTPTRR